MKAARTTEIEEVIASNDISKARKLISAALKNEPDADIYYLASLVALDDNQKSDFINKALELDPFHEEANKILEGNLADIKSIETKQEASRNKSLEFNSKGEKNTILISTNQIKQTNKEISVSSTEDEPLLEYFLSFPAWVRISIGLISGLIIGTIANSVTGYNPNATGLAAWGEFNFLPISIIISGIAGLVLSTRKKPLIFILIGFSLGGIFGKIIGGSSEDGFFLLGIFGMLVGAIVSRVYTWVSVQRENIKQPQNVKEK